MKNTEKNKQCLDCAYYHRPICAKNRVVETGYSEPCKLAKFDSKTGERS